MKKISKYSFEKYGITKEDFIFSITYQHLIIARSVTDEDRDKMNLLKPKLDTIPLEVKAKFRETCWK